MKKIRLFLGMLVAMMTLAACVETMDGPEGSKPGKTGDDGCLVLVINDEEIGMEPVNEVKTRIAYSNFSSSFEANDEVGIYCFDGTSFIASNVKFTRQSDGSWLPTANVPYNADYTYYCYFPYKADHGINPATSGDVDTRFTSFIYGDEFWKANQSTKANFDASNLLIAQGTHVGNGNKVAFTMSHKRGLAVFEGDGLNEHTFTTNIPYAITATRRMFLMKPSTSTSIGGYSLSAASGKMVTQIIPWNYTGYTLTVSGPDAYAYTGGSKTYSVTSYKTSSGGGSTVAVPWSASYDTNGDGIFNDGKPDWLTAFTSAGLGGTSASNYSATVAAQDAVIGTASDTYAARSCDVKITQTDAGGESQVFTVTQNAFTDTYTFTFSVSGPAAYDYTGGTKTYSVTSYKQNSVRTTAVPWTANATAGTAPAWITTFTNSATPAGSSATVYNLTVAAQTGVTSADGSTTTYAARSQTITFTQGQSGKTGSFTVTQNAHTDNFTVPGDMPIDDWTSQ